ncbi:MAG TPA: VLRF1 family aeRF1-type release factor [Egicoccus sp.]|nr:VLRF1 family aeRF1-type release factor [Egicoccus sp.]HSK22213.1 VLRF1 family aeRF1-type release factor [Egicoccus sp.]
MKLADSLINELIDFTDEQGVLSFYVGHTPAQAADPQPTQPIEIRNQVKALKARLADGDRELAVAVESRLDAINGELERFLDPKAHGQGRALFVGVASGRTASVALQIPFKERVVLHEQAFLRPLVAAVDEGRPAGILVVSRSGARLLNWKVGEAEELSSDTFELGEAAQNAGRMSGPSPSAPQVQGHGVDHKEMYEHRVDENRNRWLRALVDEVLGTAKEQGWDRLVLSGGAQLREYVANTVGESDGVRLLHADADWEHHTPAQISAGAWPLLRSVHEEREHELVDRALDRALSGNAGAVGLKKVCDALNEGRVAHLLFDDRLQLTGYRSSEGTLHPEVGGQLAQSEGVEFTEEPLFVERMIEKAISTGAQVTPVAQAPSAPLGEHDGVAALLRW